MSLVYEGTSRNLQSVTIEPRENMMQPKFKKLLHEPLVWKSDGFFKHSYTLYHAEKPLAHWRQESGMFNNDASIYWHDADQPAFILRPKGILHPTIEIDSSDVDFEAAKIKPYGLGNGLAIEFANGNQYSWRSVNLSGSKWILTKTEGIEIAKLKTGGLGSESTLTIVSDAPAPAELSLLIFVGWTQYIYIIQLAG